MTINFNKVYPSTSNCEVVHSWNDYGSVCVEKVMYEGTVFSYDFCVADKVYINLVSGLFDSKMYLWSEPSHEFLTKDFSLEDLNSVAEQMGVSVSQDKEQVAKDIIKEIENVISVKLNKTPCSKMKRIIVEEDGLVMEMTKNIEFDFSKYDYLPDMVDFMEDVKYMFDNHNSPNDYPFSRVQLGFDRMFEKGMVQPEEVKNQIGETFQSFMSVWIEAYSLMVGKECQLKDFFKAIEERLYVKDILPFVAKIVKEKIDRPVFKLDDEKLDRLSTTLEFDIMKNWLLPFVSTLETSENNYVVDKNVMVLLITHICLNMNIEFEQGGSEGCRKQAENLLKEYRRIFEIDGRNPADNSEFYSKLSAPVANYKGWASHDIDVENPTKLDKSKMFDGWYEVGYILGSPKGQKLF